MSGLGNACGLQPFPYGSLVGSIGMGKESPTVTVLACPSMAGSMRTAKMC